MAYYNEENEDEQNISGMNSAQEQDAPVQLSNQSSTVTPVAGQTGSTTTPKAASSGSGPGFQNFAKANQGKAQDSLNSAAAQAVSNSGQAATKAITQATNAFGKKVDAGSLENMGTAVQDSAQAIASARALKAGQAVNQSQQDRFKQVINAQYQGPESLRQAGLYNPASQKVGTAQTNIDNTKTAMGREDLLKNMYSQRGDYTSGLNKLDSALLNSSVQGVQNLQNVATAQGNLGQKLDQAQIGSANQAQNRTNEINTIKDTARKQFTDQKKAEEVATEQRLASVVKDWDKIPEYFREIIRNKDKVNQTVLNNSINEFKTANNYDTVMEQTKAVTDEKEKLRRQALMFKLMPGFDFDGKNLTVSPNVAFNPENPRDVATLNHFKNIQNALTVNNDNFDRLTKQSQSLNSQLAELNDKFNKDAIILNPVEAATLGIQSGEGLYNLGANAIKTNSYDKNRLVSKDEQNRLAALSTLAQLDQSNRLDDNLLYTNAKKAGTQSILDSLNLGGLRKGLNEAEKNFRTVADTNITGVGQKKNKSSGKTYYAQESANLKDVLANAGYNFKAPQAKVTGNNDVLEALARISDSEVLGPAENGLGGAAEAYGSGLNNMGDGQSVPAGALDMYGSLSGINALTGALGLGTASNAAAKFAPSAIDYNPAFAGANLVGNALGMGSVGNAVGGLFGGGSSSKESKGDAAGFARQDLINKTQEALDNQGFDNRFAVASNSAVDSRLTALQQLLARLDKTNS